MHDATVLRALTMVLSTAVMIAGACIACSASIRGASGREWWKVILVLAVAVITIGAGYKLFRSGYYFAYDG